MFLPIHPDRWKALTHEIAEWQFQRWPAAAHLPFFTPNHVVVWLNSGRLVACDPATGCNGTTMLKSGFPPGRYRSY